MRKYYLHTLICPLLLLLFIASCKEQNQESRKVSGLIELPAGQPKIIKTQGSDQYDNVHCSLMDKAGNLWFGTTGEGVYRYDGKSFINFTEKEGLCNNNVWSILEDTAGNIWFGTSSGVCIYNARLNDTVGQGKAFISFQVPATTANPLLQDKAGNIWFATEEYGVYRYDGKTFTNFLYDHNAGYDNKHNSQLIQCMLEDKNGNIWFGSWNNGGVFRYDARVNDSIGQGTSFTNFTTDEGFCDNMISGIIEDKAGNILFATRDNGVCFYDARLNDTVGQRKSFTNFSEKTGLPNNNIRCILEDKKGNIWFGTDGKMDNDGDGVYRYDPSASLTPGSKSLTHFTTKDGLSNNNVFTMIEDKAGNIWFGTRNTGLCRFNAHPNDSLGQGKSFTDFSEH